MNKFVIFCASFCLVAVCYGYNFEDSDFNQILSSDLEDIVNSLDSAPLHPRVRRDDGAASTNGSDDQCKKRFRKPKLCCGEDTFNGIHEEGKDISKACYKEVTGIDKPDHGKPEQGHGGRHRFFDLYSCEEVEKRKSDQICIQQCVSQKEGWVAEDGTPNADSITKYLNEAFAKESWFLPQVEKIVSNCVAEVKAVNTTPVKFYTEGLKVCPQAGITLKYCLFKEMQLNCPADQIKDKATCDKLQERLKKGKDLFGPGADDGKDE